MLKAKSNLNSKDISKLIELCKPMRSKNVSVYSASSDILKFGIGISKKNLRRAVDRNRVRRVLREIIRNHIKSQNLASHHIFIIAKSTVLGVDFTELKNEVEQLLLKAIC